jgi:hypothetical protein
MGANCVKDKPVGIAVEKITDKWKTVAING